MDFWWVRGLVVGLVVGIAGCGGGEATTTVHGVVTYKGKPVTSGIINFRALGGLPVGGGISPEGKFEFELPSGEYMVRIDTPPQYPADWTDPDRPPPASQIQPRQVPASFAGFESSGLNASVSAEESSQQIDFNLQ